MKSKKLKLLSAASVTAILACSTVVGLTSCGESKLNISSFGGIEAPYFDAYVTKTVNGEEQLASTSGIATVESDDIATIHAYDAPEGCDISWEVFDEEGNETSEVKVKSDGRLTLPKVTGTGATARKDYTVYVVASKDVENADGESETIGIRKAINLTVVPAGSIATGEQDLQDLTTDDLESIFGQVEALGLETGMTGMNFWAYGGYQKINPRVYNSRSENGKFTSSSYVPGYGFGIGAYGYLTDANTTETNTDWQYYYHSENSNQPSTGINYFTTSDSSTSTYWSIMNAPFFEKLLNESDTDVYCTSLSSDAEPIPVDENGNELEDTSGFHTRWKIHFNTGSTENAVRYRTAGKYASTWDKKGVELEDYVVPYLLKFTQWTGASNVTQLLSGNSAIVGASDWYSQTATDPGDGNRTVDIDEFLKVCTGIELHKEDNSIIFTMTSGCTTDYAAYRLNNEGALPLSFVQETLGNGDLKAGMEKLCTKDATDGSNPEDNMLCTGPYYLEKLTEDNIVYKANDDWYVKKDPAGRDVYKLAGYVYTLNTALLDDSTGTIAYQEYVAGKIDAVTLSNSELLSEHKNDSDTVHIENTGEKNGVSFNCLSKVDYDYLFGTGEWDAHACAGQMWSNNDTYPYEMGSAGDESYRTSFFEDDWEVKAILSNHNFQKGLNCGYDRDTFAQTKGRVGFSDYFGDINKMSPKASKRYNDTDAHINAVKSVYGDDGIPTNSNEKGVEYFKKAIAEELEAGHYQLGTAASPTVITLNVNWQSQSWPSYQGEAIFGAISDTFNEAVMSNSEWVDGTSPKIKLEFEQTYEGSGNYDFYNVYAKVALGQYDIAQASISGGEYEVFQEVSLWESINRNYSLTVHHAFVTSVPTSWVYYDGKYWSDDALLYAQQEGVTLDEGGYIDYDSLTPIV